MSIHERVDVFLYRTLPAHLLSLMPGVRYAIAFKRTVVHGEPPIVNMRLIVYSLLIVVLVKVRYDRSDNIYLAAFTTFAASQNVANLSHIA